MKSPVASSLSRSQSYLQKKEWNIKKIFSRVKHTSLLGENVNDAAEIIYWEYSHLSYGVHCETARSRALFLQKNYKSYWRFTSVTSVLHSN